MRSRRTGCTAASRRWSARPSASSLPVTSRPRIRSLWQLRHSPRLLEKHAFSSPTCLECASLIGTREYVRDRMRAYRDSGVTVLDVSLVHGDPVATIRQLRAWADDL